MKKYSLPYWLEDRRKDIYKFFINHNVFAYYQIAGKIGWEISPRLIQQWLDEGFISIHSVCSDRVAVVKTTYTNRGTFVKTEIHFVTTTFYIINS